MVLWINISFHKYGSYIYNAGKTNQINDMKKIFTKTCTECQSHKILYDEYKGGLFCSQCGLILASNYELFKITDYIKENKENYIETANIETQIFLK
jgi:ribosomal protein S27E